MKFPCSQCGSCCRTIGSAIELAKQLPPDNDITDAFRNFPHAVNPDGSCSKLVLNKCSIYDTRPDICRVDKVYEKYYAKTHTKHQAYELNKKMCKVAQKL